MLNVQQNVNVKAYATTHGTIFFHLAGSTLRTTALLLRTKRDRQVEQFQTQLYSKHLLEEGKHIFTHIRYLIKLNGILNWQWNSMPLVLKKRASRVIKNAKYVFFCKK